MEKEVYTQMRELEDTYWRFVGKRLFIFNFIKNRSDRILDIGCGTGVMLKYLSRISQNAIGIDNNPLALSYAKSRGGAGKLAICDASFISMKDETFDLIIASDLLEHVEEDEAVLNEVARVLKSRGRLIITVPAFAFLWSEHDQAVHHVRRYDIGLLKNKALKAGLHIEKISYTNIFAFPLVFLLRSLKRFGRYDGEAKTDFFYTPPILNRFFINCYRLEAELLKRVNFPFGVSILGVFVKV